MLSIRINNAQAKVRDKGARLQKFLRERSASGLFQNFEPSETETAADRSVRNFYKRAPLYLKSKRSSLCTKVEHALSTSIINQMNILEDVLTCLHATYPLLAAT